MNDPSVVAVSTGPTHSFHKANQPSIKLIAGLGVEGDAHAGTTVKHRSRVARNPNQPNLRQIHLIHVELHEELQNAGFAVAPGEMGENITTRGVDLLSLPMGTILHLGDSAIVEVTGLRNPCKQLDDFQPGLMAAVLSYDAQGNLIRKAGIMGIVRIGGQICAGDTIVVKLPPEPYEYLKPV